MSLSPRILLSLLLASLAAGFLAYFLWLQPEPKPDEPPDNPAAGFQEAAREAGLDFRMAFLPKEQGENFKINLYDHGCGLAVADFDGDGSEDIYFTNQLGKNGLFKNKGDGTFSDVTQEAGVGLGNRICVGATFADYDNDGLPDLYVTSTRGGNVLFKNLGKGKFANVTKEAGLELVKHCQTAVFFDYDNDGHLDLFVTCTAEWTAPELDKVDNYYPGPAELWDMANKPIETNVLYRNNGKGKFTDVTAKVGLKGQGWGGDVAVFDYDEDGRLDLLVTHMFGASQLYRNQKDNTFIEVTKDVLGRTSWGAIGSKAFDYNNDGKLDLLIVDMHSDMWLPSPGTEEMRFFVLANEKARYRHVMGPNYAQQKKMEADFADTFKIKYNDVIFGNTMFKNLGNGKFREVTEAAGLETFWPWGIATGDFNNDGYEDVFLPSGMGYPYFYWPNRLLMNNGAESFTERARAEGIEPPRRGIHAEQPIGRQPAARSSRCAIAADFRNSGQLDIVTNNFNDHPYFFKNRFPKKNYVAFRLEGTKSNRDAIGAMVYLHLGEEKIMARQVHPAGGYLSQSSRTTHFGLGDRAKIERVEIRWPSGLRQTIDQPAINKLHKIVEPTS